MQVHSSSWMIKVYSNCIVFNLDNSSIETLPIFALHRNYSTVIHIARIYLSVLTEYSLIDIKHKLIIKLTISIFARNDKVKGPVFFHTFNTCLESRKDYAKLAYELERMLCRALFYRFFIFSSIVYSI